MAQKLTEIIKKCQSSTGYRRHKAQMALYDMTSEAFYRSCLKVAGDARDAEEAMHDAYLKIFENVSDISELEEGAALSWMRKVMLRSAIDIRRRRSAGIQAVTDAWKENFDCSDEHDDGAEISALEAAQAGVEAVRSAVNAMPEGVRTILTLYLFEGLDTEEIAEITGSPAATVRVGLSRGRSRLRTMVAHLPH